MKILRYFTKIVPIWVLEPLTESVHVRFTAPVGLLAGTVTVHVARPTKPKLQ